MSHLSRALDACIAQWTSDGIPLGEVVPAETIRQFWLERDRRLSLDVLAVYTCVGGFAEYFFDGEFFWSFWPWDYLCERNRKSPGTGIAFCDHSIEVLTWEFRFETMDHSSVWCIQTGERTAATVCEFFEAYLADPWSLM